MLAESAIVPSLENASSVPKLSSRGLAGPVMLPPNPPIAIMGVPFDNVTASQAISAIEAMIASRRPHYLVTANVDFLVQAQTDIELRRILFDAHLVVCDGTPLLWASRLLGNPLQERVAGADLVPLLIEVAARRRYRLFFLGATPESAQAAVNNLKQHHQDLIIAGHYSPPFGKLLEMDHEEIKRRIESAQPDLLFVSFGCPKQEKWIAMHYRALGVPVAAGVGATIDFLAGHVRRAPVWMQRTGTEWVFRLAQEPRRLFGRYARDLWVFGHRLLGQWWQLQRGAHRRKKVGSSQLPVNPENHEASSPVVSSPGHESRVEVLKVDISPTEIPFQLRSLPDRLNLVAACDHGVPIEEILRDGRSCLLQMNNVHFIDSTGVAMLIHLQKRLRSLGRELILLSPSSAIECSLKLMRLDDFFLRAPDMSAAQQLLQSRALEMTAGVVSDLAPSQRLRWQGEITAANAEDVWLSSQAHMQSAAEASQPEVIIDLSAVRFIDSSGLGVMVRTKKLAQRHGTKLVFTSLQPAVLNVLRLSRMEEFLLGHAGTKP